MAQVYSSPEQLEILADDSHYELEELSPGAYAVHIDMDTYEALRGSTNQVAGAAQCVPVRNGISFVLITRTSTPNQHYELENRQERIPHETHHMVWDFLKRDGKLTSNEEDPHWNINFLAYQEEVLAKLTGNQFPTGYLYLNLMKAQDRRAFEEKYPETVEALRSHFRGLNERFEEMEAIRDLTGVTRKELIGGVMSAKSFIELEENLNTLKRALEQEPKIREPQKENLGWGW